jgi:cytochrome oxidase Cu insertion factor (SCO1/SenC/PrrC family)
MKPLPRFSARRPKPRLPRGAAIGGLALLLSVAAGPGALRASALTGGATRALTTGAEAVPGRTAEYDYDPPAPGSYKLPVIEPAADGRVLAADGNPCRLRDLLRGRITLLSFIYTRCADPTACPMVTGVLRQVQMLSAEEPQVEANLCLMTLSFDPKNDTPQVMASYGRAQCCAKGSQWLFLTSRNAAELEPILEDYGQRVARKRDPRDVFGPLVHNVRVFLIDREARIRNIYSQGLLDPRLVMADVQTLLLEEASGRQP